MPTVDSIPSPFAAPRASGAPGTLRQTSVAADAARSFANRLSAQADTPQARARESAEQLVSVALIEPTLKLLRESNNAAAPFAPGEAEKAFGPLLDQAISERVVRASGFGIVDRLASDLLKHGSAARAIGVDAHA